MGPTYRLCEETAAPGPDLISLPTSEHLAKFAFQTSTEPSKRKNQGSGSPKKAKITCHVTCGGILEEVDKVQE
ncbi:hypothetical protein K0M31_020032 [Melipona bicolor]|uniref:Uncharacterized protein n=1 Tax=Melipona bicolor TaxID=60889 RepID=A0AA40KQD4_9HYME|nr:hypothetical protein K0M31_020032 [Melipona bicolor]